MQTDVGFSVHGTWEPEKVWGRGAALHSLVLHSGSGNQFFTRLICRYP